jgi:hypothetical protein
MVECEEEHLISEGDARGERVGGVVECEGQDAFGLGCADDMESDFAAVGDKEFVHGGYRLRS